MPNKINLRGHVATDEEMAEWERWSNRRHLGIRLVKSGWNRKQIASEKRRDNQQHKVLLILIQGGKHE